MKNISITAATLDAINAPCTIDVDPLRFIEAVFRSRIPSVLNTSMRVKFLNVTETTYNLQAHYVDSVVQLLLLASTSYTWAGPSRSIEILISDELLKRTSVYLATMLSNKLDRVLSGDYASFSLTRLVAHFSSTRVDDFYNYFTSRNTTSTPYAELKFMKLSASDAAQFFLNSDEKLTTPKRISYFIERFGYPFFKNSRYQYYRRALQGAEILSRHLVKVCQTQNYSTFVSR